MNSDELQNAQEILQILVNNEIQAPMKNWALVKKYLDVIRDIDTKRQEAWHDETFGPYEAMADEVILHMRGPEKSEEQEVSFSSDDIPF